MHRGASEKKKKVARELVELKNKGGEAEVEAAVAAQPKQVTGSG